MEDKNYKVVHSNKLSQEMGNERYIMIDPKSGEILDNANGWGYQSKENAHRAYEYKLSHSENSVKKAPTVENKAYIDEYMAAKDFYEQHKDIQEALINAASYDTITTYDDDGGITVSIHDMTDKKDEPFSPEVVERILAEHSYIDLKFSAYTLYCVFLKVG